MARRTVAHTNLLGEIHGLACALEIIVEHRCASFRPDELSDVEVAVTELLRKAYDRLNAIEAKP